MNPAVGGMRTQEGRRGEEERWIVNVKAGWMDGVMCVYIEEVLEE